jgi:transcription termination/antitermination protein NusG
MVSDHSQQSGAAESSVPVENPEAEVIAGASPAEKLAENQQAENQQAENQQAGEQSVSSEAVTEPLAEAGESSAEVVAGEAESGDSNGETTGAASPQPIEGLEDASQPVTAAEEMLPSTTEESAVDEVASTEEPSPPDETLEDETLEDETLVDETLEDETLEDDVSADEPPSIEAAAESDAEEEERPKKDWYILKVQVNREDTIRAALLRRIKIEGLEEDFDEIVVPTEDVIEFNKSGKRKVVRKKLYPGYILVHMAINDDTWFLIRETPGVGDFTGSAGKPTPMEARDVERILRLGTAQEDGAREIKTSIPFKTGQRVRVKDGHFQNFEGQVDSIDEANGRITVMINIFNRSTPVELEHWQVESV